MKTTVTKISCDVCKVEILTTPKTIKYPVIFHTDQTEGRYSKPYISIENIDICEDCANKILMLDGWGAQGLNEYKIRNN
ncbi:hypothetical protein A7K50_03305 [Dehalobacter sp. MCB1]|uniref:hypothetical protein n=1 Tax=Dehalobacter sp. MCB1 TaxID=1844756 RepID=UPI000E6BF626|nr:hypothetical protein [Dehalobacter sp. MCB1]RJE47688.1 hypothetical protein A7K50_03305 [Dehalobacter sp. MCB1]